MMSHVQIYDDVTDDLVKLLLVHPLEGEPSTPLHFDEPGDGSSLANNRNNKAPIFDDPGDDSRLVNNRSIMK